MKQLLKITTKATSLLLLGLVLFAFAKVVSAQTKPKITIDPAYKEITLGRGESKAEYALQIENDYDVDLAFRVTAIDFKGLDETGGLILAGPTDGNLIQKYGIAKWVEVSPGETIIPANNKSSVTITVVNLDNLSPGGHYGALLIGAVSAGSNKNQKPISLNTNLLSPIFVKKIGGEIYNLSLEKVNTHTNWLKLAQKASVSFKNTGNTQVTPRGLVTINDPAGHKVASGIINTESGLILPEGQRRFIVNFKNLAKARRPGRYHIKVQYRFDGKDDFSNYETTFFYIGWYLPLTVLLILALGGFVTWRWRFNTVDKNTTIAK